MEHQPNASWEKFMASKPDNVPAWLTQTIPSAPTNPVAPEPQFDGMPDWLRVDISVPEKSPAKSSSEQQEMPDWLTEDPTVHFAQEPVSHPTNGEQFDLIGFHAEKARQKPPKLAKQAPWNEQYKTPMSPEAKERAERQRTIDDIRANGLITEKERFGLLATIPGTEEHALDQKRKKMSSLRKALYRIVDAVAATI